MTRYADTLLAEGERIALRTRQHWFATILDALYPWLILIASLVLLFISQNVGTGTFRDLLSIVILAGVVISIAWLGLIYWRWLSQDYIITNRRVIKVEGIINKRSADSSLEKINDAVLEQNLVGRILNYGDLDILTAADVAIDRYRMLNKAPAFKREMLNQKHELEGEFSRPLPSPPLRASPAAAPAAPQPREMSSDEVTRALASLADLRDRGAISAEEYEAKKAELLARL
jgi:PH (Pleckstrin Homology) domain-containing protein/putative oligomerization/nucleic acid binding protein